MALRCQLHTSRTHRGTTPQCRTGSIKIYLYLFPSLSHLSLFVSNSFQNNIGTVSIETAKKVFYHDLPEAKAEELSKKLLHQSLGVFFSTSTYAAWTDIPSTFLTSGDDRTPFGTLNQLMINICQQSVPTAFDVVEHCEEAGHCVMASFPSWTADALRRAAGEKF